MTISRYDDPTRLQPGMPTWHASSHYNKPVDKPTPMQSGVVERIAHSRLPAILSFHRWPEGGILAIDQGGFVPTPEEWAVLRAEIDRFYGSISPEEIYQRNSDLHLSHCHLDTFSAQVTFTANIEPQRDEEGWVYLASSPVKLGYKIGHTRRSLSAQFNQLSYELRAPVHSVSAFRASLSYQIEQALHHHFASDKIDGEWFELSDKDLIDIPALVEVLESKITQQQREA